MVTLIERNAKNLGTYRRCSCAVELRLDGRLKSSIGGDGIPHQVALSEDILLKLKVICDYACKRKEPIHTCWNLWRCNCVRTKFLSRLQISNEEPPDLKLDLLRNLKLSDSSQGFSRKIRGRHRYSLLWFIITKKLWLVVFFLVDLRLKLVYKFLPMHKVSPDHYQKPYWAHLI